MNSMTNRPCLAACLSMDFTRAAASGKLEDMAGYLLVQKTELAPADLIMVFGNPNIAAPSAQEAARLYKEGLAPLILASGGKKTATGNVEAHDIYRHLRKAGVPDCNILVEMNSLNTQENVVFSRNLFHKACPDVRESSMICVGHAIAGRRFPMTVMANWPEIGLPMVSHVWCREDAAKNWQNCADLRSEVTAQFHRIEPYIRAGFIREIDIPAINAAASARRLPCPA
jgi:hypothetical protein